MTISVNPSITPSFNPIPEICAGASLSPLPTTSNNGITGTWVPALNNTSTTTYTFLPNGAQCATQASTTIEVNSNPSTSLIFDGSSLLAGAGFSAYAWTINGLTIPDATTNEISVGELGLYTVTVTDANGCSSSASFDVQVVGLADLGLTDAIAIYPNPSNGSTTLSIQLLEGQQVNLIILDLQGKIQFSETYSFNAGKNEMQLNLSTLADGVYFLQLENSNFKYTKRLVKMGN
jgi:hypothetical protein